MKALTAIYRFFFPIPVNHQWQYSGFDTFGQPRYRKCSCCGEEEFFDLGGGLYAATWMTEKDGSQSAEHPPFNASPAA